MATISELSVIVGANLSEFNKKMAGMQDKMRRVGGKMKEIGGTMSRNLSLPLAIAGGAAVKFAADFESAMIEVQKVTDRTTAEKLTNSIREMAKTIPLSQEALAGLAADAARFGVRGSKNIERFTKTAANMSIATDLSAEVAGEALAKISEQADLPIEKVENMGSAITALGNNFATSESEIVSAMQRSSAAASNFGLNAQEIAGVSAQVNAMSESSERAGTRMRTLFNQIMDPSKASKFATAMGMTPQAFRRMREENPKQALMTMVDAMAQGGTASGNLRKTMGQTSIQALQAMAKDADGLRRAMDLSSESFRENTALQAEADTAAKSFNNQLTLLWNQVKNLGITFGNILLPILKDFMDNHIRPAIKWIQSLSTTQQKWIIGIAAVAAAIGPLLVVLGQIVSIAPAVGTAFTIMTGPVGAIVAGVVALIAAVATMIAKWEEWGAAASILLGPLGQILAVVMEFKKNWSAIVSMFSQGEILAGLKAVGKTIITGLLKPFQQLFKLAGRFSDTAKDISNKIKGMRDSLAVPKVEGQGQEDFDPLSGFMPKVEGQGQEEATGDTQKRIEKIMADSKKKQESLNKSLQSKLTEQTEKGLTDREKLRKRQEEAGGFGLDKEFDPGQRFGSMQEQLREAFDKRNALLKQKLLKGEITQKEFAEREKQIQLDKISAQMKLEEQGTARFVQLQNKKLQLMQKGQQKMTAFQQRAIEAGKAIQQAVNQTARQTVAGIAGIVGGIASGAKSMADMGGFLLKTLANLAQRVGKIAIGTAIAIEGIKKALSSLQPVAALAAGIALVALGAAVKGALKNASGGGKGEKVEQPALAEGGLAFGPTTATVGDNPRANVDPEVISPLSKLKGMMGGQSVNVTGEFKLRGDTAVALVERGKKSRNLRT